jgi:3D (Asp-Asp-Asp) domain-containing protein
MRSQRCGRARSRLTPVGPASTFGVARPTRAAPAEDPLLRLASLAVALLVVTAIWLAPAPTAQARWLLPKGGIAVVAGTGGGGLYLHVRPGPAEPLVATLSEGTAVMVIGDPVWSGDGLYYPVRHPNGTAGWALDLYLAAGGPSIFASGFSIYARLTGYSDGPEGGAIGFITFSGNVTRWGTVAVDPEVIPIGSRLIIQGVPGVYEAEDTGSGVKGHWIDIWFPTPDGARQFGLHDGALVTVLGW